MASKHRAPAGRARPNRCLNCGNELASTRHTAKWCSDRCRKLAGRKTSNSSGEASGQAARRTPAKSAPAVAKKPAAKPASRTPRRASKKAADPDAPPAVEPDESATDAAAAREPEHDTALVESVRTELTDAEVLDTFYGRLAVQLAKRISDPGESGISALSKELRTVMEQALAAGKPRQPASEAEVDDDLAKAREARERKAREAADRA